MTENDPVFKELIANLTKAHVDEVLRTHGTSKLSSQFNYWCLLGFYERLDVAQWLWENYKDQLYPVEVRYKPNRYFKMACLNGNLELAKWLVVVMPELQMTELITEAFNSACYGGNVAIVDWLWELNNSFDLSNGFEKACSQNKNTIVEWICAHVPQTIMINGFYAACTNGHLGLAQWTYNAIQKHGQKELLETSMNVKISINHKTRIHSTFDEVCLHGYLNVALWMYQELPQFNDLHHALTLTCSNGHMEMIQWLLTLDRTNQPISSLNQPIILFGDASPNEKEKYIHDEFNNMFKYACEGNPDKCLPLAQWLLEIHPSIDLHYDDDYAFVEACTNGHLKTAQWLYSLDSSFQFRKNNDSLFRNVCNNLHNDIHVTVAVWLASLCSDYVLTFDNISNITHWAIHNTLHKHHAEIQRTFTYDECSVCQEQLSDCYTQCIHQFCYTCLSAWHLQHTTCPYCRASIDYCYID